MAISFPGLILSISRVQKLLANSFQSSKRRSKLQPNATSPQTQVSSSQALDINAKIQATIDATNDLKNNAAGKALQDPLVSTKKRRLQDNKVLSKVRTAINERLNGRSIRRSRKGEEELPNTASASREDEEELSKFVATMDLRLNEGTHD